MIPFPNKKYNIIYADPPWTYKVWSGKGKEKKSAENHYNCLKDEDIYDLPVSKISDKNCILFIWVTYPLLIQGIKTIEKWGFEYKTCGFSWVKKNKKSNSLFWGLGHWTRANNEICLLATRGKLTRISKSVHQVIYEPIRQHSQKPDCVRDRIVELMGDLPRIELFAREKTDGWDCWGNEL